MNTQIEHGRGTIRHNAMAALVTSRAFRSTTVKPKKGKGTYSRKAKHQSRDFRL